MEGTPKCTLGSQAQHAHSLEGHTRSIKQYKQKTQHPSHPVHKHSTYFNTPRLKTLSLTMSAT